MNTLVIGGSGFLGSFVCDQLTNEGHNVRIFDRNISPWLKADQEMIVGDLIDDSDLENAISGCETIYNFAAISDLDEALHKPIESVMINVLGNVKILEACVKFKVRRYIFASTVYVSSREGGFYRCSKKSAEHYVEEYFRTYGLEYTILRYGSLYGPRSDSRNSIWRIVKKALESGEVFYEGSSEAIREYIHVEDAAKASITALGEDFRNQNVVLTGHEPMKVVDFLKMLAEIMGLSEEAVNFKEAEHIGHYVRTPYAYQEDIGRKYMSPLHVDLGQGLLNLIKEIKKEL
jgi:UDP-glucose 4-epimerase